MSRSAERVASLIAALDDDPGQLVDELAARVGLDAVHVAQLLWRMEEQGLVVHEGRRWFALAD